MVIAPLSLAPPLQSSAEIGRYSRRVAAFRYVVTDVFTDVPLAGNQLAVFTDAREIPEERLQPLARELNLAETVFVYPATGDGHARMRIFTPTLELPFAGHPVLGTAFVLGGPLQLENCGSRPARAWCPCGSSGRARDSSSAGCGSRRSRSSRTTVRRNCSPCSAWRSPDCRSSSTARGRATS